MTSFVMDCSVTMGWCFEDQADSTTDRALVLLRKSTAHVPAIWTLEVSNVLITALRRRKLNEPECARLVELLRALPIVEHAQDGTWTYVHHLIPLARANGLSSYDAAYLDLSMRLGLPLATRDRKVRGACRQVGVPLIEE